MGCLSRCFQTEKDTELHTHANNPCLPVLTVQNDKHQKKKKIPLMGYLTIQLTFRKAQKDLPRNSLLCRPTHTSGVTVTFPTFKWDFLCTLMSKFTFICYITTITRAFLVFDSRITPFISPGNETSKCTFQNRSHFHKRIAMCDI